MSSGGATYSDDSVLEKRCQGNVTETNQIYIRNQRFLRKHFRGTAPSCHLLSRSGGLFHLT